MRPYGEDLRKRIIAAKRAGKTNAAIAERFEVSQRTVERYWERQEKKGHCRVGKMGGHLKPRLEGHEKVVAAWIAAQPDQTLEELCERCQKELNVTLSASGLWHRLKAMGLSFKKKDARRRAGSP